jgi:hypothetical protein
LPLAEIYEGVELSPARRTEMTRLHKLSLRTPRPHRRRRSSRTPAAVRESDPGSA